MFDNMRGRGLVGLTLLGEIVGIKSRDKRGGWLREVILIACKLPNRIVAG